MAGPGRWLLRCTPGAVLCVLAVSQALLAAIPDPQVTRLPLIGSVEQWISSVDILASPGHRAALRAVYSALAGPD
jgi:hypothetical protein